MSDEDLVVRPERAADQSSIYELTKRAFAPMPFAGGNEQDIIDRLRADGALSLSLVAEQGRRIVAHIAFSPVVTNGADEQWFALGPISVDPPVQRTGIGTRLIREGINRLSALNAAGIVVVGNPAYYSRFGFRLYPGTAPPGYPEEYFMVLPLQGPLPTGPLTFHAAFGDH